MTIIPSPSTFADAASALYEKLEYGTIPRIQAAPTPTAPQSNDQLTPGAWTTDDSIAGSSAAWKANYDNATGAAIANGDYTPSGTLPINASGDINVQSLLLWLAIGAVAVFAAIEVLK